MCFKAVVVGRLPGSYQKSESMLNLQDLVDKCPDASSSKPRVVLTGDAVFCCTAALRDGFGLKGKPPSDNTYMQGQRGTVWD